MSPEQISFAELKRATNRLPFSSSETEAILEVVKQARSKGRDIAFGHPLVAETTPLQMQLLQEGLVVLSSLRMLNQSFVYAKVDAGTSFFGRQKIAYLSYVGEPSLDEWMPGPVFRSLILATTGIGNVYRAAGLR
jgi:hypothetical protein